MAIVSEPDVDCLERLDGQRAAMDAPIDGSANETRSLEHSDMSRDGRQRDVERFGEIGDRRRPVCEAGEEGASSAGGESMKDQVKSVLTGCALGRATA